jgi:4-nitrophenyl phosphatase
VLVGLDTSINYTKLSRAFRYLHSNPECVFLATNDGSTFPSEKGLLPGAGDILAPLLTALGPNRPATAIGKPNSTMLDAIKAECVFLRNLSSLSTLSRNYRRVFSAEC